MENQYESPQQGNQPSILKNAGMAGMGMALNAIAPGALPMVGLAGQLGVPMGGLNPQMMMAGARLAPGYGAFPTRGAPSGGIHQARADRETDTIGEINKDAMSKIGDSIAGFFQKYDPITQLLTGKTGGNRKEDKKFKEAVKEEAAKYRLTEKGFMLLKKNPEFIIRNTNRPQEELLKNIFAVNQLQAKWMISMAMNMGVRSNTLLQEYTDPKKSFFTKIFGSIGESIMKTPGISAMVNVLSAVNPLTLGKKFSSGMKKLGQFRMKFAMGKDLKEALEDPSKLREKLGINRSLDEKAKISISALPEGIHALHDTNLEMLQELQNIRSYTQTVAMAFGSDGKYHETQAERRDKGYVYSEIAGKWVTSATKKELEKREEEMVVDALNQASKKGFVGLKHRAKDTLKRMQNSLVKTVTGNKNTTSGFSKEEIKIYDETAAKAISEGAPPEVVELRARMAVYDSREDTRTNSAFTKGNEISMSKMQGTGVSSFIDPKNLVKISKLFETMGGQKEKVALQFYETLPDQYKQARNSDIGGKIAQFAANLIGMGGYREAATLQQSLALGSSYESLFGATGDEINIAGYEGELMKGGEIKKQKPKKMAGENVLNIKDWSKLSDGVAKSNPQAMMILKLSSIVNSLKTGVATYIVDKPGDTASERTEEFKQRSKREKREKRPKKITDQTPQKKEDKPGFSFFGMIGSVLGSLFGVLGKLLAKPLELLSSITKTALGGISSLFTGAFGNFVKPAMTKLGGAVLNPVGIMLTLAVGGTIWAVKSAWDNMQSSGGGWGSFFKQLMGGDKDGGFISGFKTMGPYALAGAAAGSVFPVIGTLVGGLIGGAIGGIVGYFGQEKIGKAVSYIGKVLKGEKLIEWFDWDKDTDSFAYKMAKFGSSGSTGNIFMTLCYGAMGALFDVIGSVFSVKNIKTAYTAVKSFLGIGDTSIGESVSDTTSGGEMPTSESKPKTIAQQVNHGAPATGGAGYGGDGVGGPEESAGASSGYSIADYTGLMDILMGGGDDKKDNLEGTGTDQATYDKSVTQISPIRNGEKIVWPAKSPVITSPFGPRSGAMESGASVAPSKMHMALDIRAKEGDPIYSAKSGTVEHGLGGPYGAITIRHDDDTKTRYLHSSKIMVHPGQTVQAGDPVGLAGGVGPNGPNSYKPHLHFEYMEKGPGGTYSKKDPEMLYNQFAKSGGKTQYDPNHPQYAFNPKERGLQGRLGGADPISLSEKNQQPDAESGGIGGPPESFLQTMRNGMGAGSSSLGSGANNFAGLTNAINQLAMVSMNRPTQPIVMPQQTQTQDGNVKEQGSVSGLGDSTLNGVLDKLFASITPSFVDSLKSMTGVYS